MITATRNNDEILTELAKETRQQDRSMMELRIWEVFVRPMLEDGETALDGQVALEDLYSDYDLDDVAAMMEQAGIPANHRCNDLLMKLRV